VMFAEGASLAEEDNVLRAGEDVGFERDELQASFDDPRIKDRLRAHTEEAMATGVIGVPSVVVNGAVFWGDDRLEDAAAVAAASA
jgi:2-hydroxychromene-2-carboxylate isomerase